MQQGLGRARTRTRALGGNPQCSEQGPPDSNVDSDGRLDRPHEIEGALEHDRAGREAEGIVDIVGHPHGGGARAGQDLTQ